MNDLEFAHHLADLADAITVPLFRDPALAVRQKADQTPVSQADLEAETAIRTAITTRFPDDVVLGEEFGGGTRQRSGREWIIDPIDGTANFVRGVPIWGTLVALAIDGVPSVGVVSAPALGRRWFAAAGEGAFVLESATGQGDGHEPQARRIHVSRTPALNEAFLSYNGFSYWQQAGKTDALLRLIDATGRNRAFGDFWGYMLVAEGAIDLAGEWGVEPYDLAALDVIVREAGGSFSAMDGTPGIWGGSGLATNGAIHSDALATINED